MTHAGMEVADGQAAALAWESLVNSGLNRDEPLYRRGHLFLEKFQTSGNLSLDDRLCESRLKTLSL